MYARNHTKLSITDKKFWDFSFHELGIYDIPAQIGFISDTTKQKIIYIGYSLGTLTAFIFGTTFPEIAEEKIKELICLGPAVFLFKWNSPTKYLFPLWPYVKVYTLINSAEYFKDVLLFVANYRVVYARYVLPKKTTTISTNCKRYLVLTFPISNEDMSVSRYVSMGI